MYHISLNKAWHLFPSQYLQEWRHLRIYGGLTIIVDSFVHLKQNVHNTTYAFKFAWK